MDTFNEFERLKVVWQCNILDTAREESFDHLCAVTARIMTVPYCFVGILDANRMWIKTSNGFACPDQLLRKECIANAVCDVSAGTGEIYQCSDATTHPTFASYPCIASEPCMMFYSHCPIVVDGAVVGALCIADNQPRSPLDVTNKMHLLDFAHAFSNILEERRADILFKSLDIQSFVNSLAVSLQRSCYQVQSTATTLASEIRHNSAKYSRSERREECLKDINTSLTQIALMTNCKDLTVLSLADNSQADRGTSSTSSILAVMKTLQDVLPMLVSEQRTDWEGLNDELAGVHVQFPDLVFSALLALLFPLSRVCSRLRTRVEFSCVRDTHAASGSSSSSSSKYPTTQHLVEDQCVHLGLVSFHITAQEDIAHDSGCLPGSAAESRKQISDVEHSVIQSLTAATLSDTEDKIEISKIWSKSVTALNSSSENSDTVQLDYCVTLPCQFIKTLKPILMRLPSAMHTDGDSEHPPLRVLVVDDCKMIQKVLGRFLKSQKCIVTSAENGLIGFEKLSLCDTVIPYDVVFMDFLMPVMDGLESLKAYHSWQQDRECDKPFVIGFSATAHSQEQDDAFGEYVCLLYDCFCKYIPSMWNH
mgnify:FL=1